VNVRTRLSTITPAADLLGNHLQEIRGPAHALLTRRTIDALEQSVVDGDHDIAHASSISDM
jgi:hypothetical protein